MLLLVSIPAVAQQWTRIENLPASDFSALEITDGTIYAGAGQKIYYSTDTGQNWQNVTFTNLATEARCFRKFGGRMYAGTSSGIFSAPLNNLSGTWTHHLNSGWVSSFVERDGELFASTIGGGVYKRNNNGVWAGFSNGLPSYSLSVQKILNTPAGLIAFAGANGTLYRFISEANSWVEHYYNGEGYDPGLDFDDAQIVGNTMYVSRFNKVLRSDNFGYAWMPDQTGLVNGHNRSMAVGADNLYTLTTIFTGDNNITWLRRRNRNTTGTDWSAGAEVLEFYAYALAELGEKTFIASNQGVYVKDNTLATELPLHSKPEPIIFPNPSEDGRFILKSPEAIDELSVYDVAGKRILTRNHLPAFYEFVIPGQGLFFVKTTSGKMVKTFKVIAKCPD
jgi:hypothetical protein